MVSILTNYVVPAGSAIVSGIQTGLGFKERSRQKEDLAKAQEITERAASHPDPEVRASLGRTGEQAIASVKSRLWNGGVNIFASVCNTLSSGVTLGRNILKGLNKNEKQEDSAQDLAARATYAVTGGANVVDCACQTYSAVKAVATFYSSADPEVRQISTMQGRHQGLLALASAGQAAGNFYSAITGDGTASTVATVGGTIVTIGANKHYGPKKQEFGKNHPDNHQAVRTLTTSQDTGMEILTQVESHHSQVSSPLSPLSPQSRHMHAIELARENRGREIVQKPRVQDPVLRVQDPVLEEEEAWDEGRDLPSLETVIEMQPLAQGNGASSPMQSLVGRDPAESLE